MHSLADIAGHLSCKWPGREVQIKQLVGFLGSSGAVCPNLLLYGPAATGKTSVLRCVMKELGRLYVYASCAEFSKPKLLLHDILRQLKTKKRKFGEGNVGSKNEHTAEFLADLAGTAQSTAASYVVVDHADRIADQDILSLLLRVRELTGASLGVILLSRVAWATGAFEFDTLRAPRPIQIHFPAYDTAELSSILAVTPPPELEEFGVDIFKNFLRAEILPIFSRTTRQLEDIQAMVSLLFPIYLRPVVESLVEVSDSRKLHSAFQPFLLAAKSAYDSGPGWRSALSQIETSASTKPGRVITAELDFELPYSSKFLLVAAYICARNKPTLDRRTFDFTSKSGKRHGALSHDKQVENARDMALKGPHSFPLERMLAVFWQMQKTEGGDDSALSQQDGDIFMQVSSLASLRLLTKVSAEALDEVKFKCNVSESFATKIAKNLGVKLSDYILYA